MCHLIQRQRFKMDLEHVENRSFLWVLPLNFSYVILVRPWLTHLDQRLHSLYLAFNWKLNILGKYVEELHLSFAGTAACCDVKRSYFIGVSVDFRVDPEMSLLFNFYKTYFLSKKMSSHIRVRTRTHFETEKGWGLGSRILLVHQDQYCGPLYLICHWIVHSQFLPMFQQNPHEVHPTSICSILKNTPILINRCTSHLRKGLKSSYIELCL